MFIRAIDEALEKFVRARLPLPEDLGDVTFEAPNGTWAAQLSRITVNMFLYGVDKSSAPVRSPVTRDVNGRPEKRVPQPMVNLSYLVSAWTGNPLEEHQLLGNVVSLILATTVLPPEYLPATASSSAMMSFDADEINKTRELWSSLGGQLKASFQLKVSVAADSFDWKEQAKAVERIEVGLTAPVPPHGAPGTKAIDRSPLRQ